ncbi:MAG: DsrE family protein [Gammaproteobacteria bacterium]
MLRYNNGPSESYYRIRESMAPGKHILKGNLFQPFKLLSMALFVCLVAQGCGENSASSLTSSASVAEPATIDRDPMPAAEVDSANRFFFNVVGHSREEVQKLLTRAQEIYESMSDDQKSSLEIILVMHGPDAQYFAKDNYEQNKSLVDSAAQLEAFGFIDLKVCAKSARSQGIDEDGFPAFIEVVPYGPDALRTLNEQGFTEL